jgi:hypothetical protein
MLCIDYLVNNHTSSYSFFGTLGALRGFFGGMVYDGKTKLSNGTNQALVYVDDDDLTNTRRQTMERTGTVRRYRLGARTCVYICTGCPKGLRVVSDTYEARQGYQTCFVTNSEMGFLRSAILGPILISVVSIGLELGLFKDQQ